MSSFYHKIQGDQTYTSFKLSSINKLKLEWFQNFLNEKSFKELFNPSICISEIMEIILNFVIDDEYLTSLQNLEIDNPLSYIKEEIKPISLQIGTKKLFEKFISYFKNIRINEDLGMYLQLTYDKTPHNKVSQFSFDEFISILFSIFKHKVKTLSDDEFHQILIKYYT